MTAAAHDEVNRRCPVWLDSGDDSARDMRYRSGFIAGAAWADARSANAQEELKAALDAAKIEAASPDGATGEAAREQMIEQIAQIIDGAPIHMWPGRNRIARDPSAVARAVLDAILASGVVDAGVAPTIAESTRKHTRTNDTMRFQSQLAPEKAPRIDWTEVKWMMVVNEGKWGRVAENVSSSTLTQLRLGKYQLFRSEELAHFEFAGRKPESPDVQLPPNRTNLWGRYTRKGPAKPSIAGGSFREGESLASPLSRPFPSLAESTILHWASDEDDSDITQQYEAIEPEPIHIAPADRLPGVMRTHVLRGGIWLVGYPRSLPDGSGETTIIAKSNIGETLASFKLPYRVVRAFSSFRREHIIVLDATLTVSVFDLLGNSVREFSLANNPEVRSVTDVMTGDGAKATAMIRGVDVSPISGDIAFSVLDYVWRFTSDGRAISAFRFWNDAEALQSAPIDDPNELKRARALQTLREQIWGTSDTIGRDWIYFLRFSDRDDSLFLSTYSGHLINIPRSELYESRWTFPSVTEDILETDEGMVVSGWYGVCFIDSDGAIDEFADYGGVFYSESLLVGNGEAFNPISRVGVHYDVERKIRGIYPTNGKLRVEMNTTYFDIELP